MKILIVNTHNASGGAAIACKRLHLSLLSEGYDSKLLVLNNTNKTPETYSFIALNSIWDKLIHKLKLRYFNYRYYRPYKYNLSGHYLHTPTPSVFDITQHELYEWADIINLHWVSGFLDFPSFFTKNSSKPIVWTLHDMNPFTGGCHHAEACEGFKFECKKCPQLASNFDSYNHQNWQLKSIVSLNQLTIVTPSFWLTNVSKSSSLFKNRNHVVIPNPIDSFTFRLYNKEFCKSIFNIPIATKTLLFVSQNIKTPLKGLKYLFEIVNKFDDNILILVVGETRFDVNNERIKYLGTIQDERLMALAYNASDLFILPSLAENLPNVIVESLSCGTPVVAFDVGGIPDLIDNTINGFLVEKGNTNELLSALKKALSITWDRNKISEMTHAKYNFKKQAKEYASLFEKLIKK